MIATTTASYADVAAAIADNIYYKYYLREVRHSDGAAQVRRVFFHNFQTGFELASEALCRLGLMQGIDGSQCEFEFTCPPELFREVADSYEPRGPTFDGLLLTLLAVFNYVSWSATRTRCQEYEKGFIVLEECGLVSTDINARYVLTEIGLEYELSFAHFCGNIMNALTYNHAEVWG